MSRSITNILLVDDERTDLMALRRALKSHAPSLNVEECVGSEGAVDQILATPPDIILLDINMPGLSGIEVLNQVRQRKPDGHPPVVMLSSSQDPADLQAAYREGAAAFLVKPNSLDGYRDLVQSLSDFWVNQVVLPN